MPLERTTGEYAVEIVAVPWDEYEREHPIEARMRARLQTKFWETVSLALFLHKDKEWIEKFVEENW